MEAMFHIMHEMNLKVPMLDSEPVEHNDEKDKADKVCWVCIRSSYIPRLHAWNQSWNQNLSWLDSWTVGRVHIDYIIDLDIVGH